MSEGQVEADDGDMVWITLILPNGEILGDNCSRDGGEDRARSICA
jgi:hypothetical protein